MVGVDPGEFTLRELVWMAEGAGRESWDHTASLLTLLANVNRNTKRRPQPYQLGDFHPFRKQKPTASGLRICKANRSLLKILVDSRSRQRNETGDVSQEQTSGGTVDPSDAPSCS